MKNYKFAQDPLAFRPFFLLPSAFTVVSMFYWGGVFAHGLNIETQYGMLYRHSHEMIFVFSFVVIAGFLLTAVQNWTGEKMPSGKKLIPMCGLWFLARFLPFSNVPAELVAVIDLAFIPCLAVIITLPLIKAKKYKNLMMTGLLSALFIANVMFHAELLRFSENTLRPGIFFALDLIVLMIVIIMGRLIPFFSNKALGDESSKKLIWVELISVLSIIFLILCDFHVLRGEWTKYLFAVFAFVHLMQMTLWGSLKVFTKPILLILYLAYACLPLAFLIKAFAHLDPMGGHTAIHALSSGLIGLSILGMVTRVSLGHTGRAMKSSLWMNISFVVLSIAVVQRVLWPVLDSTKFLDAILWSSGLWTLAFLINFIVLTPILMGLRVDGKAG
jgi:uncharacterized protein involved in response to NO